MLLKSTIVFALCCLFCEDVRANQATTKINYVNAEIVERQPPVYPLFSRRRGYEGWVDVAFTVGEDSAIKNIEAMAHSGVEAFIGPAIQSVGKYKYKAATLNGTPVDSLQEIRIVFMLSQTPRGATNKFVRHFKSFRSAIVAEEFEKAAEYLANLRRLRANNLYEDAFLNLAEYYYGLVEKAEPLEQIARLDAATRVIDKKPYIAKSAWADAMRAMFFLKLRVSDYGAALYTYSQIPEGKTYEALRAELLPAVKQILNLRSNDKPFATKLKLNRTGFNRIDLLKPVFAVSQLRGEIHRFRLVCDAGIKAIEFVEDAEYQIPPSYGRCCVHVKGAPDTEFSLVQLPVAESQTP